MWLIQTNWSTLVCAVTDIFQMMMMMMMMGEHTWSWASEPARCFVHPRAFSLLPWGGTAVLTPPSDVICDSLHQNWLSGNGCCILIADTIRIRTLANDKTQFGLHCFSLTLFLSVFTHHWLLVCQSVACSFSTYRRKLRCLKHVLIVFISSEAVPIPLYKKTWFYDLMLHLMI